MPGEKPKDENRDESNSEFERFERFVKKIAPVPKEEVDEKHHEYERERTKRKRAG